MDTTYYRVTMPSSKSNTKTGPIPVTTTSSNTCSDACPFKRNADGTNGCYADGGPLALIWAQVNKGKFSGSLEALCDSVAAFSEGQLWRHNQAGDLPGEGDGIDIVALAQLTAANSGRRGFTYTHKPMIGDDATTTANRNAVAQANRDGFTINLSGNNAAHADTLADFAIAPVVSVLPIDYARGEHKGEWTESLDEYRARVAALPTTTPKGRKLVVCPATYRDGVTCATCQLCQRQRESIVGFPAHGASKRKASAIASA